VKQWNALKLLNGKRGILERIEGEKIVIAEAEALIFSMWTASEITENDAYDIHIDEVLNLPFSGC
jgi:hypothetical protein